MHTEIASISASKSPQDDEKQVQSSALDTSSLPSITETDTLAIKAARRKIDKRLLLWYSFVYLVMRIHVSNISNTAIMNVEEGNGIKKELGNLDSAQWAWTLSIFYYPYMVFEPVSTMLLKKFSPKVWMMRIMLVWGIISMCQGATQNYAGMLACRFFLGMAEAGFYPGVLYHLSFWYPTHKLPLRIAFFYACGMFSGTISGLLAYAISFMNQLGGLSGWRWVFILEGIPAILCAIVTWFILPNYPETSTFLTESERELVLHDLPAQAPSMNSKTFNFQQIKDLFADPTFVPFLFIWALHGIGGWGISFVLPTVILDLGITNSAYSQLMTMPPYTLVFIILLTLGWLVHTKRINAWVAGLGLEILQIILYILLITVKNKIAKYIFVMIATAASQSFFALLWPERIRAAKGTSAAGMAIGMTNAICQLMGIVGPQIYQSKFGPTYLVSYACSIGLLSGCVVAIVTAWYLVRRGDAKTLSQEEKDSSLDVRSVHSSINITTV